MFDRLKALMLLSQCNGRDIWPVSFCREQGVPESWIDELADSFESGFRSRMQEIYVDDQLVNQFYGVQDLDLAYKLGEYLGVDTQRVTQLALSRTAQVRAIQAAVEEE
jgi:hypothetical protein